MGEQQKSSFFESQVLGHPAGLFVLFFTEMWERFSFYGMRVLLINFLTIAAVGYNPGWEWSADNATALFGTYAMLLYLTPILGGIIADKFIGYRWAVVVGAIIMTLGHASMAFETEFSLYIGLGLLVIGTGFFKPTMTSIISEMYKDLPEKKDGAYTIFYMGVNAGAFFGMMLCGYLAERVGWSWGFGLAGIFMLLGTLQFWLAKPLFGSIGEVPSKNERDELENKETSVSEQKETEKRNPFTQLDIVLIFISAIIGLLYAINDPLSKIAGIDLLGFLKIGGLEGQYVGVLIGLVVFLYLVIIRIIRYDSIVRDRMIAVIIFAFFTVFFWLSFEQGASSLVLFARDSVQRELLGNSALIYNVINALLTVIPLVLITYVLFVLGKKTLSKIPGSNIVLAICFAGVWGVVIWMINRDFNTTAYNVEYTAYKVLNMDKDTPKSTGEGDFSYRFIPLTESDTKNVESYELVTKKIEMYQIPEMDKEGNQKLDTLGNKIFNYLPVDKKHKEKHEGKYEKITKSIKALAVPIINYATGEQLTNDKGEKQFDYYASENNGFVKSTKNVIIGEPYVDFQKGQEISIIHKDKEFKQFAFIHTDEGLKEIRERGVKLGRDNGLVTAKVKEIKNNWVEVTVSWFSILNSFFIIAFANLFSKWWDSKYNPSAPTKYGLGLIIMAVGFGLLAFGSYGIVEGVKVSMVWLILAYLFHTLGELCISPVGLSYVSKLVPPRMIAFMFGMWYLAIAIGNKAAAVLGGQIEKITEEYSLSTFFLIFTIVPIVAGIIIIFLNPVLKKLMHGVK